MPFKERLKKYAGDFVRVGGALGVVGSAAKTYEEIAPLPIETVADYMNNVMSEPISAWFSIYGLGEGINAYKEFKARKDLTFPEYVGKAMKIAPLLSFPIAYATDGDFFKSVLLPAAICVVGYGLEYIGKAIKKSNKI
jgi:hypothetical protein